MSNASICGVRCTPICGRTAVGYTSPLYEMVGRPACSEDLVIVNVEESSRVSSSKQDPASGPPRRVAVQGCGEIQQHCHKHTLFEI